jgi:hypothetical protein
VDLLCDTHIHVYPCHDPAALFLGGVQRLRTASGLPNAAVAFFLTEAAGHHFFRDLISGDHRLPKNWTVHPSPEPEAIRITYPDGDFLVFAGHQIVTAERVELLALTLNTAPPDGLPASECLTRIQEAGAIPVLAWAPGKWMFSRADTVRNLVNKHPELHLGDSSLRARGWSEPVAMRESFFPVLAGSDPLPFAGEEIRAGEYGIHITLDLDPEAPVTSIRTALASADTPLVRVGQRNSPLAMLNRLRAHHQQKSKQK